MARRLLTIRRACLVAAGIGIGVISPAGAVPPTGVPKAAGDTGILAPKSCVERLLPSIIAGKDGEAEQRAAARELAFNYEFGLGVAKNLQCALDLFRIAAEDVVIPQEPVTIDGATFTPRPIVHQGDLLAKSGLKRVTRRIREFAAGHDRIADLARRQAFGVIQPPRVEGLPDSLGELLAEIYPLASQQLGEEGKVRVQYCLGSDGFVNPMKSMIVTSSGYQRLDDAALGAVISGDIDRFFRRARDANGTPTEACAVIPLSFVLER